MTLKFCINCKHFSPKEGDPEHRFARCSYSHQPSLVTGLFARDDLEYCTVLRGHELESYCGIEGKHFEEKAHV